ncbi:MULTISPECIES: hypothetical protein [Chloroflexus]|uniref:hypothetical protein n=1 Tax=Chloroflexus TaxID=1107 RepID=UPI000037B1E7|nr:MULTISPECIES: hypothetical protein [Chloroflexus]
MATLPHSHAHAQARVAVRIVPVRAYDDGDVRARAVGVRHAVPLPVPALYRSGAASGSVLAGE